ncbi:MAG: hypothetical protein R3F29_07530 [Planctomycetota bacterium]
MKLLVACSLLLLPLAAPVAAQVVIQVGAPTDMPVSQMTPAQLAAAELAWQQHLAENRSKLERGDTGKLTITVKARDGEPLPARLQVKVNEHVPEHAKPGPFLVETHHFVQFGTAVPATAEAEAGEPATEARFVIGEIPIGLMLEVEVWPADDSAPHTSYRIAGPTKRGEQLSLETRPAMPFPVLTGRLLDGNGMPVCHGEVALEVLVAGLPCQFEVHTDIAGRFRAILGVPPPQLQAAARELPATRITMVPGKLIRRGGYRFWTTEMPAGARATKEIPWPTKPITDLGDLQLGK